MSVVQEPEVKWSPDKMVEVVLSEPDDFLKVRETLTRISKEGIILYTSRNFLPLMENMLILLLMMSSVGIVLLNLLLTGDWLVL